MTKENIKRLLRNSWHFCSINSDITFANDKSEQNLYKCQSIIENSKCLYTPIFPVYLRDFFSSSIFQLPSNGVLGRDLRASSSSQGRGGRKKEVALGGFVGERKTNFERDLKSISKERGSAESGVSFNLHRSSSGEKLIMKYRRNGQGRERASQPV